VTCRGFVDIRVGGWLLDPASKRERADPFAYDTLLSQHLGALLDDTQEQTPSLFCKDLKLLPLLERKIKGNMLLLRWQFVAPLTHSTVDRLTEQRMMRVFEEQEMKLQPILASMESCGISIDLEHLTKNCDVLKKRISLLEQRFIALQGTSYQAGAPTQYPLFLQGCRMGRTHIPPIVTETGGQCFVSRTQALPA